MLAGTVFIIVLLGSVMRRKDNAKAGTVDFFRAGNCAVQPSMHVCSKNIECIFTHL